MQYGKIDGTVRTWFSDGKPDMVQEYRQGKRNGKEQRFDPKSGKQIYEANYTDDRKEGNNGNQRGYHREMGQQNRQPL